MSIVVALALTCVASLGFGMNEWTHGGVSEAMGLGHHHLLHDSYYHCYGAGSPMMSHSETPCSATGGNTP